MYFCCMENEVNESFEILLAACRTADSNLAVAYKQLRDLLERLCRAQMQDESLQMTDLSARISFVSARAGLTIVEQNRLHTFRLTSNAILNRKRNLYAKSYCGMPRHLPSLYVNFTKSRFPANSTTYCRVPTQLTS